jgi:tetratricopeptide (TPR) repeat protein
MIKAICEQEAEKPSEVVSRQWSVGSSNNGLPSKEIDTDYERPSAICNPKLLRGDLDNIVLMALRKDPRRRYASVEQFSEDIRRYLDGLPVKAHKESVSYRASKFVRRNRIAVSAAVVILTTLIGAIVITSWEAHVARAERARAERRFNDVRKLADTYMFEFHDSIKDLPGSLPARQLLIKRALEYLDSLAAEAAGDRALQAELAQAYQRVGEISFDVDQIIASRQKAMSINQTLSAAEPANQDYRRALAESYTGLSDAMKIAGHTGLQLEYARRAVEVYPAPSNIADQSESDILVTEYLLLGLAQDSSGDTNSAIASARRAYEIQTVASAKNPNQKESLRALAITLGYVSHFLEDNGQYAEALNQSEQALEIARTQWRAEPSNVRYQRDVAMGAMRDGRLRAQLGQTAAALESLNSSLQQLESLSAADPGDKGHRFWLGVAYFTLANTLANSNQTGKASANYLKATSMTEQLVAADAKWWEAKRYLTDMYVNFGSLQTRNGQTSVAANYFRKAIELAEESSRIDPQNVLVRSGLARAYEGMAVLSMASAADPTEKTSGLREALDWYQKSLNIYEDMKRNGTLSGADAGRPGDLGTKIATCAAALNGQ